MDQEIAISINKKIAQTQFDAVVSFNSVYRLKFTFDEEWDSFPSRVAVVMWAGGGAEALFEGDECAMPQISSAGADTVLVGVYSKKGEQRIASSFVRLRCEPGAGGCPSAKPVLSLHEQVLAYLNEKDWSLFNEKVAEGVYSAVRVDPVGLVTEGLKIIEVGEEGVASPSEKLSPGGIFFRLQEGIYTPCYFDGETLEPLTLSAQGGGGNLGHPLNIGEKRYNGSEEVTVTADDFGLADVATSGSYNDLTDKPQIEPGVTSVNGETGSVVLTRESLGLGRLAERDYVDPDDFGENSIPGKAITNYSLNGSKLILGSVGEQCLADGAVTGEKLAEGAIVAGENVSVTRDEGGNVVIAATASGGTSSGGEVTSVNGQTGEVTITKQSLGLDNVTSDRQMPLFGEKSGGDLNEITASGFYHVTGSFSRPCTNAPTSGDNLDGEDCSWFLLVMASTDGTCTQVAFSARTDGAIRVRGYFDESWNDWVEPGT